MRCVDSSSGVGTSPVVDSGCYGPTCPFCDTHELWWNDIDQFINSTQPGDTFYICRFCKVPFTEIQYSDDMNDVIVIVGFIYQDEVYKGMPEFDSLEEAHEKLPLMQLEWTNRLNLQYRIDSNIPRRPDS